MQDFLHYSDFYSFIEPLIIYEKKKMKLVFELIWVNLIKYTRRKEALAVSHNGPKDCWPNVSFHPYEL